MLMPHMDMNSNSMELGIALAIGILWDMGLGIGDWQVAIGNAMAAEATFAMNGMQARVVSKE